MLININVNKFFLKYSNECWLYMEKMYKTNLYILGNFRGLAWKNIMIIY